MKKRIISAGIVLFMSVVMCLYILSFSYMSIVDQKVPLTSKEYIVSRQEQDINIIPDKYNTGAKEPKAGWDVVLRSVEGKKIDYNGVTFIPAASGEGVRVNFYNYNGNLSGVYVFENLYIPSLSFMKVETITDRDISLIFNNCYFGSVNVGNTLNSRVHTEFNSCTMSSFIGVNSDLNNCYIAGSYEDGLRLFSNVNVKNCYICDRSYSYDKVYHTDGVQIYGTSEGVSQNINFSNCRFELPQEETLTPSTYINASLMIQLEYGDASNFTFDNCFLNSSGSYAIYAWDKNIGLNLSDINFTNIKIGCLSGYGNIYPIISEGVNIDYNTVVGIDSIYVASVFKKENSCYLSVSNDTNIDRTFRVYASSGKRYDFSIEKCPSGDNIGNKTFNDFPFDKIYEIPEDSDWIVCFEVIKDEKTGNEKLKQVRYENWTDEEVVLEVPCDDFDVVIAAGDCGSGAEWELYDSGELHIDGEGATSSYSSGNVAPWYDEYRKNIKKIVVDEGITSIGNQNFRQCVNVTDIEIAETVTALGDNTFIQCNSLTEIDLPSSIMKIGKNCFASTPLKKINFKGTEEQWNNIVMGANSSVDNIELLFEDTELQIIADGQCGDDVFWKLLEDGQLILSGEGKTYNYSSNKCAPWYDSYREKISSVVVENGITELGTQLFRNCTNLVEGDLADSVTIIGNNAFIKCENLKSIKFSDSVDTIGKYTFAGTNVQTVYYKGNEDSWNSISVGRCNDSLLLAELILE